MILRHANGTLDVTRPVLMGVVNASPESFSDSAALAAAGVRQRAEMALGLVADGARVLDIGGQSARTDQPELDEAVEIDRVVPLIEAIRESSDVCLSVDTYRPAVADAALAAGADIVNDVSGVLHGELLDVVARRGAGMVVMHTRLRPKQRLQQSFYDTPAEVVADVVSFLTASLARVAEAGIPGEYVMVDPGPDFAKTPAQTVAALQALEPLAGLGCPVLLALSRKDFVGAATSKPPRARQAGTLAAIGWCIERVPQSVLRVHDVAAVRDYLAVLDVLDGRRALSWDRPLDDALRYDRP